MSELVQVIAGILATPPELFANDPLLAERVKAARALCVALTRRPLDVGECDKLADRLLMICAAPAAPAGRQ